MYHSQKKPCGPEKKETLKEQGFYKTTAWRRIRVQALERDHYLCQKCLERHRLTRATEVHHILPLEDYPESALVLSNLMSLCWDCHEQTKHRKPARSVPGVRTMRVTDGEDGDESVHEW